MSVVCQRLGSQPGSSIIRTSPAGDEAQAPRRVVLIGATGTFGSRLARMLARMPDIELVLVARGGGALDRLRMKLVQEGGPAVLSTAAVDRTDPATVVALRPWLTIDAAGPFQGSGYALPLTVVRQGSHWLDLADGRDYVAGFVAVVDPAAKAAAVVAVTGASSTPTLSNAVADQLTAGWSRIDAVRAAILPGARAPRGPAVTTAILGWAGQPVRVFRGSKWRMARGWSLTRRIEAPGLGRRWASLCETPDLDILPARFALRCDGLALAGLQPSAAHLGMGLLSRAVACGLLRSLAPVRSAIDAVAGLIVPFGSDRGGMVVEAEGADGDGRPIAARWTLIAKDGAGPNVPAAPAVAVTRALLAGQGAPQGALVAAGWPNLGAILAELVELPISTSSDEGHQADPALFRRVLGRAFDSLPEPIRRVHAGSAAAFCGHAVVRTGRGLVPAMIRRALGLPRAGHCAARVTLNPGPSGEVWLRDFAGSRFSSRLACAGPGLLEEGFGPLRFQFRVRQTAQGLCWDPLGWSAFGIAMPMPLAPLIRARIGTVGGDYQFRIVVAHRWIGLLFAYRGVLGAPLPRGSGNGCRRC